MKQVEYSKDCASCGLFLDACEDERVVIRHMLLFGIGLFCGSVLTYLAFTL